MASASSGDLSSENQRPIICLNNSYKWFTSCLQIPLDIHLTHTTWRKGNREGRRLNVAESHTTSSLTRWWPRIVIEVNGLWAWHGSMWRKHMVPCTKHGSPKWWTYSDYPVGYAMELHEQLTPTKVYSAYKTRTSTLNDVTCRLCGKSSEILTHVLAGCSGLAQTKYLERHNAALKMLFFEMLKQHKLVDIVPP